MSGDVIDKVRDVLLKRGLVLTGSIARVALMLPERGRINVMTKDASGIDHAVTLNLGSDGIVSAMSADEFSNVRTLAPASSDKASDCVIPQPSKHTGRIGRRKR